MADPENVPADTSITTFDTSETTDANNTTGEASLIGHHCSNLGVDWHWLIKQTEPLSATAAVTNGAIVELMQLKKRYHYSQDHCCNWLKRLCNLQPQDIPSSRTVHNQWTRICDLTTKLRRNKTKQKQYLHELYNPPLRHTVTSETAVGHISTQTECANTSEVASARTRLDATLQLLVDKKDDSHISSDEENPLPSESLQPSRSSPAASPRKSTAGKSSRKRKRKDSSAAGDSSHYHYTYVMKLFDRSVDLAQFDEETPLYPICKAWMKNQPHNRQMAKRDRTPTPEPAPSISEEEDVEVFPDVYKLPSPIKVDPTEPFVDLRIPSPLPQPDEHLDINAPESSTPEELLLDHMGRWKKIRQRWREASHQNEMRYSKSLSLLRKMMERQCKDS